MKKMTTAFQGIPQQPLSELSRRRFVGMAGAGGLALLTGCGGGQEQSQLPVVTPPVVIPPSPQVPSGALALLAGGLGGSGRLEGRGTLARLLPLDQVTVNKEGVIYFGIDVLRGKVSAQGDVTFLPDFPFTTMTYTWDMACDSKGDLYGTASGINLIYKLVNGAYVPFAGAADPTVGGFLDDMGTSARLRLPQSPAFDSQDNLYFIDRDNHAVRKVAPNGRVSTVAGTPSNVSLIDGKGSAAGFAAPRLLVVLADDSLLVVDGTNWRKILPDGTVSTLVGSVASDVRTLQGTSIDSLYTIRGHSVVKLSLDGSTVVVAGDSQNSGYDEGFGGAARFKQPLTLALSANGQLFVADNENAMIRRVDLASGQVSAWAGLAPQPGRIDGEGAQARLAAMGPSCVDKSGNVYVVDIQAKTLRKIAVSANANTPAVVSTLFTNFPTDGDVAVDAAGNFYGVRDHAIIKVTPSGVQQVFAGQPGVYGFADGLGSLASFAQPGGLALDSAGNLYVGDEPTRVFTGIQTSNFTYGGTLRMITPSGLVSTVAGTPGRVVTAVFGIPSQSLSEDASYFYGMIHLASDADGVIWVTSQLGIRRVGGTVGAPVWILKSPFVSSFANRFAFKNWVCASDSNGGLWVADNKVIHKVLRDGSSSVVVGGVDSKFTDLHLHNLPSISGGVKLGALPGSLGEISFLAAVGSKLLYCGSENSVIRVQLN